MPRYIDTEKLTEALREKCDRCEDTRTDFCSTRWCDIAKVIKMIDNAPTADVVERKKGFWEWVDDMDYRCSVCHKYAYGCLGEVLSGHYKYCPYCGAKMIGDDADEED